MGRKQNRIIDGAPVKLAARCLDCGAKLEKGKGGLDRCPRDYLREYRKRKALTAPAPATILPRPESDFEPVSMARKVSRYLRAL